MPQLPRTQTWHLPQPDVVTQPYWDAAARGVLLYMRCDACGEPFSYPRAHCPLCWSGEVSWHEAAGTGSVYTFTVIHQNDLPPFNERVPYVVAIVELDEGIRMTTNLEGIAPEDVACGLRVRVAFREEARDEGTVHLPVFGPA